MLSANAYLVKHQDATRALAEKLKAVHSESKVADLNVSLGSLYSTCCEIWVVVCGECAFSVYDNDAHEQCPLRIKFAEVWDLC
jgi:rubrerythrin